MTPLSLFFTDPVLAAPTIGTMFMGFSSALLGVPLFVRKRSLMGEALSHAAYPGVTFAVFLSALLSAGKALPIWILIGAFLSCTLAFYLIEQLIKKLRVNGDAALCFTLAAFFGGGVTIASVIQFSHGREYRQIQAYLYGQAATMTEVHIYTYALLLLTTIAFILFFYKEIQIFLFDAAYAKTMGVSLWLAKGFLHLLIVLAIIVGIRSVGVVLMSAMLIGPAIAARCFTDHLSKMFCLAGLFGMGSALLGVIFSVYLSEAFLQEGHNSLPTGPMIVLVIALLTFLSLLFAPHKGFVFRFIRIASFRFERICENILKTLWHASQAKGLSLDEISRSQGFSKSYLACLLLRLRFKGLVKKEGASLFSLTDKGRKKGARIIRLHRIWELYLVEYLGANAQKVHKNAEEMEHIITPELEAELTLLLDDPKIDPHKQPIPSREEACDVS